MMLVEEKPVCHRKTSCIEIQSFKEVKRPKQLIAAVDFVDMENPVSANNNADEQIISFHSPDDLDGIDTGSFVYADKNIIELELSKNIHKSGDVCYRIIKDICVDEGSHLHDKIIVETDKGGQNYSAGLNHFASKDEDTKASLCANFLCVTVDGDSIEDLLIPQMPVLNDSEASFEKGYDSLVLGEVNRDKCNGSLLGDRDSLSSDNQMISDSCSMKSNVKIAVHVVDNVGRKKCTSEYFHEKIVVEEENYSAGHNCFTTKNDDSKSSICSNNISTADGIINDLVVPQIPILNDSKSSYEKGYDTHVIDDVNMDTCNENLVNDRGSPCSDSQMISDLCIERSNVKLAAHAMDSIGIKQRSSGYSHEKIMVETDKREETYSVGPDHFAFKEVDSKASLCTNNLSMVVNHDAINDILIPQIHIPNDSKASYEKGHDIPPVIDEINMDKCNGSLHNDRDPQTSDNKMINALRFEKSNVTRAHVVDDVSRTHCSSDYLFDDEMLDRNGITNDKSIKGSNINHVQELEVSGTNQFEVATPNFCYSGDQKQHFETPKKANRASMSQSNLEEKKLVTPLDSFSSEADESRTAKESLADLRLGSGVITFTFDSKEAGKNSRLENNEIANCQQFGQPSKIHPTEERCVESSTVSARNSFVHQIQSDTSSYGPAALSGRITFSGHIPYSGSISLRSDSSTTSAGSFAFPILQSEWNSSPVRMVKADRRHLRKLKRWRMMLICCRF